MIQKRLTSAIGRLLNILSRVPASHQAIEWEFL
jgi:hypothetical protein